MQTHHAKMINQEIAEKLREIAQLLQQQGADSYRVSAYQKAAVTVEQFKEPINKLVEREGIPGLVALPNIGEGIARSIFEYVVMQRMSRLDSLRGGHDPVALFEKIPGIGAVLAHRIIEILHIDSLEALEVAAHNKRLEKVPGFSSNKVAMVNAWLAQVLGKRQPAIAKHQAIIEPEISLILQIDELYRKKANNAELPTIAPKRFNPTGEAWLPIMHITKKGWHFTALYSNTARAHQLNRTRDWVVIYFYDDQHHENQHTVVTETHGVLEGKRVVRGREAECVDFYT